MDASGLRRTPADTGGIECAEVVAPEPSVATEFLFRGAIKRVKTDPQPVGVGALHERAQPRHFLLCPLAGVLLTVMLNHVPGIVPPASIVVRLHVVDDIRCGMWIFPRAMYSAEREHPVTKLQLVVEHGLLLVRLAREHQDRLDIERFDDVDRIAFWRRSNPRLIRAQ